MHARFLLGTLGAFALFLAVVRVRGIEMPLFGQIAQSPACDDGADNDGDGKTDYPADLGCLTNGASNEWQDAECFDGSAAGPADNDRDGAANAGDFGCTIAFNGEIRPKAWCGDGTDNDGDGLTDYPEDSGCASAQDHSER